MTNEIAISIYYKANEGSLTGLEEFKNHLKDNYVAVVKPTVGPAAGGVFDFVFDIAFNLTLKEFVEQIVVAGIAWDLIKYAGKNFFLRPFMLAIEKLQEENKYIDFGHLIFRFDDAEIKLHGPYADFSITVSRVFQELAKSYNQLIVGDQNIYEIHIPLVRSDSNSDKFTVPEIDINEEDYFLFWGISYDFGYLKKIWDLQNKKLIDEDWYYWIY